MTRITIDRAVVEHALEAFELVTDLTNHDDEIYDAIAALRAALAEPAEPVAIVGTQEDTWKGYGNQWEPPGPPIKTVHMLRDLPIGAVLYTAPPQRKPLTDEEIDAAWDSVDTRHRGRGNETRIAFARAIERAHGITS